MVWLELNKINGAKISTLNGLKDVGSKDWVVHFDAYKDQLGCPVLESQQEEIHWLLGKAIHLETSKNSMCIFVFGYKIVISLFNAF